MQRRTASLGPTPHPSQRNRSIAAVSLCMRGLTRQILGNFLVAVCGTLPSSECPAVLVISACPSSASEATALPFNGRPPNQPAILIKQAQQGPVFADSDPGTGLAVLVEQTQLGPVFQD